MSYDSVDDKDSEDLSSSSIEGVLSISWELSDWFEESDEDEEEMIEELKLLERLLSFGYRSVVLLIAP